jgi:4-amino-4-deoxy-L-arabinose transferase-like glycosyltransferase
MVMRSIRSLTRAQVGQGLLSAAIFVVGAAFRLGNLGSMRITYDNSYTIFDALRGLAGAGWPAMGQPSSVFLPSPLLMTYVEALPLVVWRSPWAVAIFIVSLNTLAIGFVFWAARQLLGNVAGYIAAFLFAINPWLVFYSRETWVSSLMPFFVTLIAASLWPTLATDKRSSKGVLIAGLTVAVMTSSYVTSLGLLISIGLLLFLFRSVIPRRPVLIGGFVFAVGMIVYGLGLLTQRDTTVANLNKFLSGGSAWQFNPDAIYHALRFVTGMDFHAQYPELRLGSDWLANLSIAAYSLLTIVLIIGIGLAVRAIWQRRPERRTGVVLLIWYGVPILLMTMSSHQVHPYYLLLSVPAGSLLAAWGFLPFARRPIGRVAVGAVLCGCAVIFGLNLHWYNVNVAQHPTQPKLDGWTLNAASQLGDVIRQLTPDDPSGSRVVVDTYPPLPGAFSGKYVRVVSGVAYPNFIMLPGTQPLLYILVNQPQVLTNFGPHAQTFPTKTLQFADGTSASFVRVMPYDQTTALELPQVKVNWQSTSGLTFLGYTLNGEPNPGTPMELVVYWRVGDDNPIDGADFVGASYQLFDATGQRRAQTDGHAQWAHRWEPGDIYVEQAQIDLPPDLAPGNYELKISLYDSIHQQSFQFEPPEGTQATYDLPIVIATH